MRSVKALVVAVNRPGMGPRTRETLRGDAKPLAASPDTWEVTVTWMSKPYSFTAETGEVVHVKPKKRKHTVFTQARPELHSWIMVQFL
jgi:hypothetical protein